MRIAFDLDDTLVPCGHGFETEPLTRRWAAWLVPTRMRRGTSRLLAALGADGHTIWVYTTSKRRVWEVRLMFLGYGVWLEGVVNDGVHAERVRNGVGQSSLAIKYPPEFGIHLLADDSVAVQHEGVRLGYDVVRVDPGDPTWVEKVLHAVGMAGWRRG